MYESFFGFSRRPFTAVPQAPFYFPATNIESAKKTLTRCITRSEGPALVVGQAGTGKTLLCLLLQELFRDEFRVCHLSNSKLCSRRALLQAILFELGQNYRNMEEGELRLSLIDFVSCCDQTENGLLLLVDEAHTIPLPLLEELRMITNLVRHGESRVRLVIAGLPQLEERFASPKLESFSQRIAARCYLETLTRAETPQYIRFQLTRAGAASPDMIDDDAVRVVHAATEGVPRLINQLCDHALVMAAVAGSHHIDTAFIQEAWTDLQQLPAPTLMGENTTHTEPQNDFIEFGSLEDTASTSSPTSTNSLMTAATNEVSEKPNESWSLPSNPSDSYAQPISPSSNLVNDPPDEKSTTSETTQEVCHVEPSNHAQFPEDKVEFTPTQELPNATHNPFDETFQEEEVVIDRFVSIRLREELPQVTSREGQEIADLLPDTHPSISLFTGYNDELEAAHDDHPSVDSIMDRVTAQLTQAEQLANGDCPSEVDTAEIAFFQPTQEFPEETHPETSVPCSDDAVSHCEIETLLSSAALTPKSTDQSRSEPESNENSHPANTVEITSAETAMSATSSDVELHVVSTYDTVVDEIIENTDTNTLDIVHPVNDNVVVMESKKNSDTPSPQHSIKGRARRLEYGQLFAKLRRG